MKSRSRRACGRRRWGVRTPSRSNRSARWSASRAGVRRPAVVMAVLWERGRRRSFRRVLGPVHAGFSGARAHVPSCGSLAVHTALRRLWDGAQRSADPDGRVRTHSSIAAAICCRRRSARSWPCRRVARVRTVGAEVGVRAAPCTSTIARRSTAAGAARRRPSRASTAVARPGDAEHADVRPADVVRAVAPEQEQPVARPGRAGTRAPRRASARRRPGPHVRGVGLERRQPAGVEEGEVQRRLRDHDGRPGGHDLPERRHVGVRIDLRAGDEDDAGAVRTAGRGHHHGVARVPDRHPGRPARPAGPRSGCPA